MTHLNNLRSRIRRLNRILIKLHNRFANSEANSQRDQLKHLINRLEDRFDILFTHYSASV
jgi:hypothetical protein